jgi:flagellar basal-body rod modification protein FlgD
MPFDITRITAPRVSLASDAGTAGSTSSKGVDTVKKSADATDVFGLSKDDFFKMFLSQLKNQDPTAPMDDKEMLSEMAQFTMIDTLQQVQKALGGTQLAQASALIGDQVIGTDVSGLPASGTVDRIVQDPTGLTLVLEGGALMDPASVTQVIKPASTTGTSSSSSTATT